MKLILHQNIGESWSLALLLISGVDHSSPLRSRITHFLLTQLFIKNLVYTISHAMRVFIVLLIAIHTNSFPFLGVIGFL